MLDVTVKRRMVDEKAITAISEAAGSMKGPSRQFEFMNKYFRHLRERKQLEKVMAVDFGRVVEGAFVNAKGQVAFLTALGQKEEAKELSDQMKAAGAEVITWTEEKVRDHNGREKQLWDLTEPVKDRVITACKLFD